MFLCDYSDPYILPFKKYLWSVSSLSKICLLHLLLYCKCTFIFIFILYLFFLFIWCSACRQIISNTECFLSKGGCFSWWGDLQTYMWHFSPATWKQKKGSKSGVNAQQCSTEYRSCFSISVCSDLFYTMRGTEIPFSFLLTHMCRCRNWLGSWKCICHVYSKLSGHSYSSQPQKTSFLLQWTLAAYLLVSCHCLLSS